MAPFTIVTALPKYVSPEEHKEFVSSTPASFSDIPPVLRHKQENVSIVLEPPSEDFPSSDCQNGILYVIESALVFFSSTGRGLQTEYPTITLHAISRAESGPSIYCQLDESLGNSDQQQEPTEDAEEEDVSPMRELSIIPKDTSSLDPIFEALSYCASLHPDPEGEDDMDDDDDDDAFIDSNEFETFNGDEGQELSEVGRAALAHMEGIIYNPFETNTESDDGAFDDEAGDTTGGPLAPLESGNGNKEKE